MNIRTVFKWYLRLIFTIILCDYWVELERNYSTEYVSFNILEPQFYHKDICLTYNLYAKNYPNISMIRYEDAEKELIVKPSVYYDTTLLVEFVTTPI